MILSCRENDGKRLIFARFPWHSEVTDIEQHSYAESLRYRRPPICIDCLSPKRGRFCHHSAAEVLDLPNAAG